MKALFAQCMVRKTVAPPIKSEPKENLRLRSSQDEKEKKLKKVDCGLLPPCQNVLRKKILRTELVARTWYNADQVQPSVGLDPTKFGWVQLEGSYHPDWYSGPALPRSEDLEASSSEKTAEKGYDEIEDMEAEWTDVSDNEDVYEEDF